MAIDIAKSKNYKAVCAGKTCHKGKCSCVLVKIKRKKVKKRIPKVKLIKPVDVSKPSGVSTIVNVPNVPYIPRTVTPAVPIVAPVVAPVVAKPVVKETVTKGEVPRVTELRRRYQEDVIAPVAPTESILSRVGRLATGLTDFIIGDERAAPVPSRLQTPNAPVSRQEIPPIRIREKQEVTERKYPEEVKVDNIINDAVNEVLQDRAIINEPLRGVVTQNIPEKIERNSGKVEIAPIINRAIINEFVKTIVDIPPILPSKVPIQEPIRELEHEEDFDPKISRGIITQMQKEIVKQMQKEVDSGIEEEQVREEIVDEPLDYSGFDLSLPEQRYTQNEIKQIFRDNYKEYLTERDRIIKDTNFKPSKGAVSKKDEIRLLEKRVRAKLRHYLIPYFDITGNKLRDDMIQEGYDLDPSLQVGFGQFEDGKGLYDDEIMDIMKGDKTFKGVISNDEISILKPSKNMSFISNLDNKNQPGSHWVATYIDADKDKEINYFDPLGDEPSKEWFTDMKDLVDKINPDSMLKVKINNVPNQKDDTDTCGWQCMRFIKDRNNGVSFKKATGYIEPVIDNTEKGEMKANVLKRKFNNFI